MSEAVPLSSALGIHGVEIVICKIRCQFFDLMLEHFAAKRGLFGAIQWQVHRNDLSSLDLLRRSSNSRRGKEVETSNLASSQYYKRLVDAGNTRSHCLPTPKQLQQEHLESGGAPFA